MRIHVWNTPALSFPTSFAARRVAARSDQEIANSGHRGSGVGGFCDEDFADHAQQVAATLFRWNEQQRFVGENHQAHLVAIMQRAETQHGGGFRRDLTFAQQHAAIIRRTGNIDRQNHREFPLLMEFPDEWLVHPRGDVPIDEPHFVTVLVFAEIIEIQTLPAE